MSIDLKGWIKRKGKIGNMFKREFAVLQSKLLTFYTDETQQEVVKEIQLSSQTKVALQTDSNSLRFIISASPDDQIVICSCETPNEAIQWVDILSMNSNLSTSLTMDDFAIIAVLGRGFYGKVMLVQKKDSKELFALKTIHKERLIKTGKLHTVISERNILMKIQNPFIIALRFAFQTGAKFYLGMEFASGGELFNHMDKCGSLPIPEIRFYMAEISYALHFLHSLGVIYRDLKPENVMLDENGHIKLTDFGLAKDLSTGGNVTSTMCGTTEYLAPEIILGMSYNYEADWWALGILAFEMVTETTPFFNTNKSQAMDSIAHTAPDMKKIEDDDLRELVSGLLLKDPKRRFTFDDIKKSKFMADIDWFDCAQRKITPPFVPQSIDKTKNFNEAFTDELPLDSYISPASENVPGFSFIDSLNGLSADNECDVFADDPPMVNM